MQLKVVDFNCKIFLFAFHCVVVDQLRFSQEVVFLVAAKAASQGSRSVESLVQRRIGFVVVHDLVLHRGLVVAVEDDPRPALFHVVDASVLQRSLAFARLQVLVVLVEQHCAAFVVGDQLDLVGDVGADESCGQEICLVEVENRFEAILLTVGVGLFFRVVVVLAQQNSNFVVAVELDSCRASTDSKS